MPTLSWRRIRGSSARRVDSSGASQGRPPRRSSTASQGSASAPSRSARSCSCCSGTSPPRTPGAARISRSTPATLPLPRPASATAPPMLSPSTVKRQRRARRRAAPRPRRRSPAISVAAPGQRPRELGLAEASLIVGEQRRRRAAPASGPSERERPADSRHSHGGPGPAALGGPRAARRLSGRRSPSPVTRAIGQQRRASGARRRRISPRPSTEPATSATVRPARSTRDKKRTIATHDDDTRRLPSHLQPVMSRAQPAPQAGARRWSTAGLGQRPARRKCPAPRRSRAARLAHHFCSFARIKPKAISLNGLHVGLISRADSVRTDMAWRRARSRAARSTRNRLSVVAAPPGRARTGPGDGRRRAARTARRSGSCWSRPTRPITGAPASLLDAAPPSRPSRSSGRVSSSRRWRAHAGPAPSMSACSITALPDGDGLELVRAAPASAAAGRRSSCSQAPPRSSSTCRRWRSGSPTSSTSARLDATRLERTIRYALARHRQAERAEPAGPLRRADRARQSLAVPGPSGARAGLGPAPRSPGRGHDPRPQRLQGGQRSAGPRRRRSPAGDHGASG